MRDNKARNASIREVNDAALAVIEAAQELRRVITKNRRLRKFYNLDDRAHLDSLRSSAKLAMETIAAFDQAFLFAVLRDE